ncbi:MAG TPA: hypothetical protein DIC64_05115 [Alphaproteobacteria bacterium]|nr:hypothetical protein [Alphaproteobacteria bacterium]
MDINKKIHQTLSDPYNENPLGGMIHLSDFVDMESEISFLDFYFDNALCDLSDIEKLQTMNFIKELTNSRVNFDKPFAYLYFTQNDENIKKMILEFKGMKQIISKLKKYTPPKNEDEILEFLDDYL